MNASGDRAILRATRFSELQHVCLALIILITGTLALSAAQSEERKFKKKEFADMPIRIRTVRNLQSDTWPDDLEIEVENVSNRPIYFVNAVQEFPDDPISNGVSGIVLKYGRCLVF